MDDDRSGSLRVVSWNLWWRFGDWRRRFEVIRATLTDAGPDICGLQEVWATDASHQGQSLAAALGMHLVWAPSPKPERWQRRTGEHDASVGTVVLSRWPVEASEVIRLPPDPDDSAHEGRTALAARISSPAGPLLFVTTQLNSAATASAIRRRQVDVIAEFVGRNRVGTFPPVVTGDFNAQPDSDEVRRFEGHLTAPAVPGQVLIDAWRYAEPGQPGLTWDVRNPNVAATFEPSARIDYIFVGAPGPGGQGHVQRVGLIGNCARDDVWPSDHAGLIADLAMPAA
jgi:endonuclease/exonuclease/phosphatase family metal-dependent hydrolase